MSGSRQLSPAGQSTWVKLEQNSTEWAGQAVPEESVPVEGEAPTAVDSLDSPEPSQITSAATGGARAVVSPCCLQVAVRHPRSGSAHPGMELLCSKFRGLLWVVGHLPFLRVQLVRRVRAGAIRQDEKNVAIRNLAEVRKQVRPDIFDSGLGVRLPGGRGVARTVLAMSNPMERMAPRSHARAMACGQYMGRGIRRPPGTTRAQGSSGRRACTAADMKRPRRPRLS
jgi:hypothetical protein